MRRFLTYFIFILGIVQLFAQAKVSNNQDLIRMQSYLNSAKRFTEFNDYRNAYSYYKKIIEIDWLYENSINDYLLSAIKSGAVKEAEAGLLKIYSLYRDKKIVAANEPGAMIISALVVFYLSTDRDQIAEEFTSYLTKSGISAQDKTTLLADIYDRSGRQDLALSTLETGRKTLNNNDLFAWQFYKLYLKKNDYVAAGRELIKHLAASSAAVGTTENQELQVAEAELTKLIELTSTEEIVKIVSQIENRAQKIPYFYKVLSSVYFTLKDYNKSFDYYKKVPSLEFDNNADYLTFARELHSENELEFAIVFYEKYFAVSANIPLNVPDFFNYINLLFQKDRKQQGLTILESPSLPNLVNPVFLDLFKANTFLYTLKQPAVSEKIIDKYINNLDLPGLMAIRIKRDVLVFQQDYKTAFSLNNQLLNSDPSRFNSELEQDCRYANVLLLLLNDRVMEFKEKAIESVKRKNGTDSDNDLLTILQDYQMVENKPQKQRVFLHFVGFKLHKQPDKLLDSLKAEPVTKLSPNLYQSILYDYLKETDYPAAKKIVSSIISSASQSDYLPYMIFDLAKRNENETDVLAETEANLLHLIKNYPKSLYLEPSRKLLRKIQSRRPGGVTPKL